MRVITKIEVSQKQAFIFSTNTLKDMVYRSNLIAYIMSVEFIKKATGKDIQQNLIYSGGGHVLLEFDSYESAGDVVKKYTNYIHKTNQGVEVFVKSIGFNDDKNWGEKLKKLDVELEAKKAMRLASFHQGTFGIESIDSNTRKAEVQNIEIIINEDDSKEDIVTKSGYKSVSKFEELGSTKGESSFIAVVHIDGNAMAKRFEDFYDENNDLEWESFKSKLRELSNVVDIAFEDAFKNMQSLVIKDLDEGKLDDLNLKEKNFPVRKIILAGDDICFVSDGRIGIECAVNLIREVNKKGYSACAGIAIVHQKYPFYIAYELAEKLCGNAKKMCARYSQDGYGSNVSAIDWHIEYGEMKDHLDEIRRMYNTNDGKHLEMRPYIINADADVLDNEELKYRQYEKFRNLVKSIIESDMDYANGKMKELRNVLKQGEESTEFYLRFYKIGDLIVDSIDKFNNEISKDDLRKLFSGEPDKKCIFVKTEDGKERSILFDAIEISDTFIAL